MSPTMRFIRLSRPHFLIGGVLMFALGVFDGPWVGIGTYLLGQGMVSSAQVTAHYVNEYSDFDADRLVINRTMFSGGSGVLNTWGSGRTVALRAAWVATVIVLALGAVITFISPLAALLGILALSISWLYSIPPVRLLGTGFGELATSLVVVGVVPLIGVSITGAAPSLYLWWVMGLLLPIHLAMMLVFELPDIETDRRAEKRVVAVRLGRSATLALVSVLMTLAASIVVLGIVTSRLPPGLWWSVAVVVIGGPVMLVAGLRHDHQLATMSAVATLAAAAASALIASV